MKDIPDHVFAATKRSGALLPDGDRLLLVRLWCFADDKERRDAAASAGAPEDAFAFPCIKTLQRVVSAAERTVYDRLARLEDAGWIRRARRIIKGRECYGWELAEADRYCGGPQVHLRQPKDDPAAARNANPQVNMRPPASQPAADRRGSCGSPHHTNLLQQQQNAEVVVLAEQRRANLERELVALVIDANVGAGVGADGRYVADIVRRVERGDCTVDDVRAITVRYRRWKGEEANQKPFHVLFYDDVWPSTQRVYLDRALPSKQKAVTGSALPGAREYWAKVTEAAPPDDDEPYTDEDAMRDYLAMTGMSAT